MDCPSTELAKPPVPYTKGSTFTAQSHIPPAPTPVTRNCCHNSRSGRKERSQLSPVKRCLKNPPLQGTVGLDSADLKILDLLKVGDGRKSQIFTVRVSGSRFDPELFPETRILVAKVYDPLYFDDQEGVINPFLCVDQHYTHEVHVYQDALRRMQGHLLPRFHGSYSLELPVESSQTRTVRLILLEYVPGISMHQADSQDFTQDWRMRIMNWVISFESLAYKMGVLLTDLRPQNVILLQSPEGTILGSVFLDFGGTLCRRDDPTVRVPDLFLGKYISPLLRWDEAKAMEFIEWIDCDFQGWIHNAYAHTAILITPEMREAYA
ncbi:uncharacterized protein BDW47DRAFT_134967 [Aspergillus candidus]|uniref:Protein kinase domain-containing protein n=1 Tax=Aspergillus candidus TaxID=41067 RepID=A0A2I2EZ54_ASPCN|nr:hypothetical protein BDW47DRAFT_134967 [Aspergillus candidus]PLB33655.1 hypothetical protein BDW47DRAFT_134967 [Aspergillus candidus]